MSDPEKIENHVTPTLAMIAALPPWKKGDGFKAGEIHCQWCNAPGETVRWSRAAYNGHFRMWCSSCDRSAMS